MAREVSPQRLYDAVAAHNRRRTMYRLIRECDSDKVVLVDSLNWGTHVLEMVADHLKERLLDPDFNGILWDNKGLKRVLTRDILQEGLDIYRMAHLNIRSPISSHVGTFLWEQTISREEADQCGQARTSDSTGSENEPDQGPLEA